MIECKTILDVRTDYEFEGGHIEGSVNIPLDEIPQRLEEIKALPSPIAICCLSGNRSATATQFLELQGFDCFNAGGWMSVKFSLENGTLCLVK